ncbi:BAG domain-containing protein, partial [Podospora australis]
IVKVATSAQAILASSGAFATNLANNITSVLQKLPQKLPPSLQTYLDTTVDQLSGATDFIQSNTGLSPTTFYTALAVILLVGAVPVVTARNGQDKNKNGIMRRYGFSRGGISPFGSTLGPGGVPNVTEDDFSYITSEDLETHGLDMPVPSRSYASQPRYYDSYSASAPAPAYMRQKPEDDVMLVKHQGITYPEHFPAYSIGDGKLYVSDVRERVKMILDLTDRQAKRIKLYYKGRPLRDPDAPVRSYGVKNNSEVLMVLDDSGQGSSDESNVSVGHDGRERRGSRHERSGRSGRVSYRPPQGGSPRTSRSDQFDNPRAATSSFGGLDIPDEDRGSSNRAKSRVRTHSPTESTFSSASAPVGVPGGPIEKLNTIASHFEAELLPLCVEYVARTPSDPKKRDDDHRRISETIMSQVLLKLDEIDTSAEDGARARRKELVKHVQDHLKKLDDAKR